MSESSASSIKPYRARSWGQFLPPALFLAFVLLSAFGFWRSLDRGLSDLFVKIRIVNSPLKQNPRIYPVNLNDSAERNLGDLVDNRQAFSDLLKVLGQGQLNGGLDFLFQKNKDPDIDKTMAQNIAKMSSLVLAIVPVPVEYSKFTGKENSAVEKKLLKAQLWHPLIAEPGNIPFASTFILPVLGLSEAAQHLGHIAMIPEDDGLYRKIPLFYRWENGYMPAFALVLAAQELKVDLNRVEIHAGSHVLLPLPNGKSIRIPIDRSGFAWVPYPSLWDNGNKSWPLDKVVSMSKDLKGTDELINEWSDGIVIAADITTGQKDFGSTPIEAVYPLAGLHTSLLNGILTNTFYSSTSFLLQLSIVLAFLFGIVIVNRSTRGITLHFGFVLLLILLLGFVSLLWFGLLILPWFFGPALGLTAAWVAAFGMRVLKSHEDRLLLESALSRYFSRALALRVLTEKKIDLIPVSKEVTVMFADIAGFTRWSSDKSPELVHSFLSDYLESMASIIFAHGGTIDKFMGDGILAFFGDPLDQPDHAERSLHAALAMQVRARELREAWLPKAEMDLKIRIGVNTGPAIVGNLGSQTRIEYTVIGATVNFGQRMESNAPVGGILVSEATWAQTRERFRFGEIRSVTVKGYEAPVTAYVLETQILTKEGTISN